MISIGDTQDFLQQARKALVGFWDENLKIAPKQKGSGYAFALPLMLPDGLQVVVHVNVVTSTRGLLTDNGEILSQLSAAGVNIDTPHSKTARLLEERLGFHEMKRDGLELTRQATLPLNPVEIQVFAEGLTSIAYLIYRHDVEIVEENVANQNVMKVFSDRRLSPQRNAVLTGKLAKKIKVDYYLPGRKGLALEVISRRTDLHSYMEQWGFRWGDLHETQPRLVRAMIYDPEKQPWDDASLELGKNICEYFCPYHQTDRIAEAIEISQRQ